jgi:hypothetical protein
MRRNLFLMALGALALTVGWHGSQPAVGQVPVQGGPRFGMEPPRFPDFATVTKGAKEYDGLFKLYQKDDHLYMEIRPDQLNKPVLCPIAIARGAGLGGYTLNFDEQWVLVFKRVGDKIQLIRRNVHFKANPGSPIAKAVETTYTDSVLMALPIATINMMKQAPLINLNNIFMTDFAQLGMGYFDANRSSWHKIKAFPRNIELQVEATYGGGGGRGRRGGDETIDSRGNTIVIHYGLCALPEGGYTPRVADDRVGYFLSAVKDFSTKSKDTSFTRYVNRWRLEPAEPLDPQHPERLSPPKQAIVFWLEKTIPHEFRPAVRAGILEWNKAFEKVGIRDAIEVRQQKDSDDWDPEDMNYNTIRWITTDSAFAMGPSRANPLTGEILDADIIFDASWVQYWKHEHRVLTGEPGAAEPVSTIQAMDQGWGLQHMLLQRSTEDGGWSDAPKRAANDPTTLRLRAIQQGLCQCGSQMKYELGLGAMMMAARGLLKPGEKVPDELIQQAIKEVVMHEVGHTLGLRHNFKGSTMLPNDQLHNTKITREKGLVASVMDYNPVNLAPKGVKQGDYFTTTIGPYDYWAIEYAYKPVASEADLKKIASRGAMPGMDYGTDEDTFLTADPLTNRYDLGADVMKFAEDRLLLAEELMKGLADRVVEKGEGYQRARVAFSILLGQYGNSTYLISKYVGGEHAHRDHKDDPKARDPLEPVSAAKQRDALKFLQEHVLTDKTFQFPPKLLRKLAVERWYHWGAYPGSTDFPLYDRILAIQRVAMANMLNPTVLRRVQMNALKTEDKEPVTVAEVFRTLTEGVWSDIPNGMPKEGKRVVPSSIIRRNLQRQHLKDLSSIVLGEKGYGSSVPPDARSLARMHLREVDKRIDATLNDKQATVDETTRAHLEECHERIGKVLNASMQVND